MRFYITIGACNLSVWLVVFHSFHIVRYIFWGQVEVLSMVTGKPKTLAKLSGSKSDKTYICPKMQALPIMPKSLEVSTKRSRDGMWRWVENITSHHCNDRHCVQGHHVMLAALDTSSSKDLVEMAVPWYHGPSFMGGIIIAIIMGIIGGVLGAIPAILQDFFHKSWVFFFQLAKIAIIAECTKIWYSRILWSKI